MHAAENPANDQAHDRASAADPSGTPDALPVSPAEALPPVEAPSAGFLLQLFFIPLLIVAVIVTIWTSFGWLVHSASDPKDLVRDIRALNDASWQKAYTLSDLLRDPSNASLKQDSALAEELADVLRQEIATGAMDKERIKLRVFLSRVLGEFRLVNVVPALVEAAKTQRDPQELAVRRSALEGLAVLAGNLGGTTLREQPGVLETVLEASRERSEGDGSSERDELRATAAFVLGLLGGDEARERLVRLLDDAHVNTRYNAATGLARLGDPRSVPVLLEMLDPNNDAAWANETAGLAQERKRLDVQSAAIAAAVRLAELHPDLDRNPLRQAIHKLATESPSRTLRAQAEEAVQLLDAPAAATQ